MTARLCALAAALSLVAAACGNADDGETATTGVTTTTRAEATTTVPDEDLPVVSVYFLHEESLIVGEARERTTEGVVGEALGALFRGLTSLEAEVGLTSAVPGGTRLRGVALDDGVARVDLTGEFESGGGSLSVQARVAQVVFTATQFSDVDRVRFSIEGREVDAIGGEGVVVGQPLGREDFEFGGDFGDARLVPPVLLESPRLGETIQSPLRVTGSANVFEATFGVEVVDGDGLIVAEETVTATSGSGDRGTFDATLTFEPRHRGLGAIITFVESARDGSRQDVREVPIRIG